MYRAIIIIIWLATYFSHVGSCVVIIVPKFVSNISPYFNHPTKTGLSSLVRLTICNGPSQDIYIGHWPGMHEK